MSIKARIFTHPFYSGLIVILAVGGGWYWYSHRTVQTPVQYVVATVKKETIISSVKGTGQVSTLKRLDLKPQTSGTTNQGTLIKMNVVPGQKVSSGEVIAVLDDSSALVSLAQAQASLLSAEANYDKIIAGTTATDLKNAKQSVVSASSALQNAKTNLDTVTQQQNTAVVNAYRTLLTSGIAAAQADWPYTSQGVTKSDLPTITGSYALTASGTLHIFQQGAYFSVSGIVTASLLKFDTRIPLAIGSTGLYIQFPNDSISAEWDIQLPNPQGTSYVSNLTAYQSALLAQKQALNNAQNSVVTAETTLQKAEDDLALKEQPADDSSVASAKAQLINAQSNLRAAQYNYTNTRIIAPFAGQIAVVNSQKGDQVSGSTIIATLITEQKIATVSLNEIDAAKVAVGNPVTLTFDALPDLSIAGKVSQIDLLGSASQGVVNYNVQISFDTQDERVRSGMSAAAAVITNMKSDILAVQSSAVKTFTASRRDPDVAVTGGQSYVQVVDQNNIATQTNNTVTLKNNPTNVNVETGMSNDTLTEITNGLQEGAVVVVRTISKAASTQTTGGSSAIRIPGIGGGGFGGARGN
ncbi:MAG: HlyD family efflux transporter periplasmic adaptor subunit [Patescibacteria group bacterium]